jgi:hypothetical protein
MNYEDKKAMTLARQHLKCINLENSCFEYKEEDLINEIRDKLDYLLGIRNELKIAKWDLEE